MQQFWGEKTKQNKQLENDTKTKSENLRPLLENLSTCKLHMDTQQALGKAQETLNHKITPFSKERKKPWVLYS